MKIRNGFLVALLMACVCSVNAAPVARRGAPISSGSAAAKTGATAARGGANAARAAAKPTAARGAGTTSNTGAKTTVAARSATPATGTKPQVARAGATQKVIGTGTKVAAAQQNVAIDPECQKKYNGCMDAFCVMENTNGGRCQCSNKIIELDKVLAEIESLDQQSYKMATSGVESIEYGINTETVDKKKPGADLSAWGPREEKSNVDEVRGTRLFAQSHDQCIAQIPECNAMASALQTMYSVQIKNDCTAYDNALKQKRGESQQKLQAAEKALRDAALDQHRNANKYDLGQCTVEFTKCMQTTAECGDDFVKCAAVAATDNTSTRVSTRRVAKNFAIKGATTTIEIAAQTYDTLMAKKPLCDTVTKQCTNVADQVWQTFLTTNAAAIKFAETRAEDIARQNCIGTISDCFLRACKDNIDPNDPDGSYDMCLTRPATMLNVCQVPLNNCGIDASSPAKAQKSPIWDYVEARLAAMRVNACTNELRDCLQSADRCGADYSQCVGLSTDTIVRMCPYDKLVGCQKVYKGTDIRGDDVYDELYNVTQGIMLNIDNKLMEFCQGALDESMVRVCGSTENCDDKIMNTEIGGNSLFYGICWAPTPDGAKEPTIRYDACYTDAKLIPETDLGRVEGGIPAGKTIADFTVPYVGILGGTIYWTNISFDDNGKITGVDDYLESLPDDQKTEAIFHPLIKNELEIIQNNIDNIVNAIESDATVQYCINGRRAPGMKTPPQGDAKFPSLTKQMRMIIANSALRAAQQNYFKKYDKYNQQMLIDKGALAERIATNQGENDKDIRREAGRQSCIVLPQLSMVPKSKPLAQGWGKWVALAVVVVAAVVATVFTFGTAAPAGTAGISAIFTAMFGSASLSASSAVGFTIAGSMAVSTLTGAAGVITSVTATASAIAAASSILVAGAAATVATVGAVIDPIANAKAKKRGVDYSKLQLTGTAKVTQDNYEEEIDTTYNWETLECKKCVRYRHCKKVKKPAFGSSSCKRWEEFSDKECTTIQF